jgi:hypothetical protein
MTGGPAHPDGLRENAERVPVLRAATATREARAIRRHRRRHARRGDHREKRGRHLATGPGEEDFDAAEFPTERHFVAHSAVPVTSRTLVAAGGFKWTTEKEKKCRRIDVRRR